MNRDVPDHSRAGVNIGVIPALQQDSRGVPTFHIGIERFKRLARADLTDVRRADRERGARRARDVGRSELVGD